MARPDLGCRATENNCVWRCLENNWSTAHAPPSVFLSFKNISSDCSYDCTRKTVNVFGIGITLPDRSETSLAATTPCRLQQYAVSGSSYQVVWSLSYRYWWQIRNWLTIATSGSIHYACCMPLPSHSLSLVGLWVINSPMPLSLRSKASVCGRWIAGFAGLSLADGMDVRRLCLLCVM